MKLKFKAQPYQTDAVQAVIDCFAGQPKSKGPRSLRHGNSRLQIRFREFLRRRLLEGTNAYLYLEGIDISKQAPVARIEQGAMESDQLQGGIPGRFPMAITDLILVLSVLVPISAGLGVALEQIPLFVVLFDVAVFGWLGWTAIRILRNPVSGETK